MFDSKESVSALILACVLVGCVWVLVRMVWKTYSQRKARVQYHAMLQSLHTMLQEDKYRPVQLQRIFHDLIALGMRAGVDGEQCGRDIAVATSGKRCNQTQEQMRSRMATDAILRERIRTRGAAWGDVDAEVERRLDEKYPNTKP